MSPIKNPTEVIGYVRVSTDDQAENGYGLDAQIKVINDLARRRGWPEPTIVKDTGSGKRVNGNLRDALQRLSGGRADALIVAKLDRLARSVSNAAKILEQARNQGWNLVICDLGMDLSTPTGKAMANMLATFAEFERDMISARTKEGLAAAKAKGVHIGRPRQVGASIVNRIVELRQKGNSYAAIAERLAQQGILSPEGKPTWQPSTVRRIFNAATKEES